MEPTGILIERVTEHVEHQLKLVGIEGPQARTLVVSISTALVEHVFAPLCLAVENHEKQLQAFAGLIEMLGHHVGQHAQVLQGAEPEPALVTCYCGWRRPPQEACIMCGAADRHLWKAT